MVSKTKINHRILLIELHVSVNIDEKYWHGPEKLSKMWHGPKYCGMSETRLAWANIIKWPCQIKIGKTYGHASLEIIQIIVCYHIGKFWLAWAK